MIKKDVYSFIDKVQEKAINALKEKYAKELENAIEKTLNEPQNALLKEAINSIEKHLIKAVEANRVIKKYAPRCSSYASERNVKKDLFCCDTWYIPTEFEAIKTVHAEREESFRRTREEYSKIKLLVQRKRTAEQGKEVLISLGFDVTYLDNLSNLPVVVNSNEIKVDKSLLFPCKETGV